MSQKCRRRNYFIEPAFQLNFILKFCSIVIVSSVIIGIAMFIVSQNSTTVAIENTKVIVKPTADFILFEMIAVLLIVAAFSSVVVLALTLVVSSKISGPIYRIQEEILLLQQGDLTRGFNIRDSDQLQQLAASLNSMTQTLKEKVLKMGGQCRSLSNFIEEKNLSGSLEDHEKLLKITKELYETLTYFKV